MQSAILKANLNLRITNIYKIKQYFSQHAEVEAL